MKALLKRQYARIIIVCCIPVLVGWGLISCTKANDPVTLTFTSWRIDDVEQMNLINEQFTLEHPDITIRFDPYDPTVYDNITSNNLAAGTGADILFLWSYDKGRALYDAGYLYDLTGVIPNLSSYPQIPLNAWTTESGITYGVPSVGVTHGIYYNKSIFNQYNIQEPTTWGEFISACETLLKAGITPISLGVGDNSWVLYRVAFSCIGPNFYGGEAARQALMSGSISLTDSNFLDAFTALNSLKKYLPTGYETLGYEASKTLFASGGAAMFIGGSWEISVFEKLGINSTNTGWFASPVKTAGDKLQYCCEVDAGIGLNKNSRHLKEALEYIQWVAGSSYAESIMADLPGFFSYTPGVTKVSNTLAQKMLDTKTNADQTVRLMDEKLNAHTPGGDALMSEALLGMMLGTYTPAEAAAWVQQRLVY